MKRKAVIITLILLSSLLWSGQVLAGTLKPQLFQKVGCLDLTGKTVIEAKYEKISSFKNGLAVARLNGKDGFIDTKGRIVLPFQYDWAENFSEGLARFNVGGKGNLSASDEGVIGGKWGFLDSKGQVVIAAQFARAWDFSNGFARVYIGGQEKSYAYIDQQGNFAFPYRFEDCRDFTEDGAWVQQNGNWYLLDKTGKLSPTNGQSPISQLKTGLAVVSKEGGHSSDGLANFVTDSWGYVDEKGKVVIPPKFSSAEQFGKNGLARASQNGKIGYIDQTGKSIIPFAYADVSNLDDGMILASKTALNNPMSIVIYNEKGQVIKNFPEVLYRKYMKSFLLKDTYSVLAAAGLTMRKKPAINGEKILQIPALTQVKVLEKTGVSVTVDGIKGQWVMAQYKGQKGYIFDGFLSKLPAPKDKYLVNYIESWQGKTTELIYSGSEKYLEYLLGETGVIEANYVDKEGDFELSFYIPGITLREGFLLLKWMCGDDKVISPENQNSACLFKELSYPGEGKNSISITLSHKELVGYTIKTGENGYIIITIHGDMSSQ